MGIVRCYMCKGDCSPFYNWTSSRFFPREKLFGVMNIDRKEDMKHINLGVEVCFQCCDKLMKEK